MPDRIQLRRTKGWRKPEGAIVVARPSKWGNPHRLRGTHYVDEPTGREHDCAPGEQRGVAVRLFREHLTEAIRDPAWGEYHPHFSTIAVHIDELRGHDLACWCPLGQPCHADVLLELANPTEANHAR